MTDLVETGKVKRQYMKANLIIHPDKVRCESFMFHIAVTTEHALKYLQLMHNLAVIHLQSHLLVKRTP